MMIEFVGLPGCGKTTLTASLERRLVASGFRVQGLRNATKALMAERQASIGFVRHRPERISLYGLCLFAQTAPELHDWVVRTSHGEFTTLIWNMEAMSQLGIVAALGPSDLAVLNDEGFLQRLASNFISNPDDPKLPEIISLVPRDILTVAIGLSPERAFERARTRRKGIPLILRSADDEQVLDGFKLFDRALTRAIASRKAQGSVVLEIDGNLHPDQLVMQVVEWVTPLLEGMRTKQSALVAARAAIKRKRASG